MMSLSNFVDSVADAETWLSQDSKQRLKAMQKSTLPITASAFNRDGSIFAYSVRSSLHGLVKRIMLCSSVFHAELCAVCS